MANEPDGGSELPYYVREPQVMRLPTLLTAMREGSLRVPDFQRGFVWNASQRLGLFDSIAKGFPIGTILVWRTTRPEIVGTVDNLGPLSLPSSARRRNRGAELILDGQQRLTTLYIALSPDFPDLDGRWSNSDDLLLHATNVFGTESAAREWTVYVDPVDDGSLVLEDGERDELRFCRAPRWGPVPPHYVPLYLLLKNISFSRFLAARSEFFSKRQIERVERLASIFKDYSVPVVPIVTDDVKTAIKSFERVNTQATPLTQFDIAHAIGRSKQVDVAGMFRQIREHLDATSWGEVDDRALGYTAKLAVGMQAYSPSTSAFVDRLASARDLPAQIAEAMVRAVVFLRDRCGVHGAQSVPYQFQLVLLSELFRRDTVASFSALEEGAERWFWMTTFSEHFASQRRIQFALEQLVALAQGARPARIVDDPHLDPLDRIRFMRARVKGFLLWFAKTFDSCDAMGIPMRVSHELGIRGHETVHPLIPRDIAPPELLQRAGNVLLCPPEMLLALREALLLHPERCSDEFLRSHAITGDARKALVEGRHADFILARHAALDAMERAFVTPWGLDYLTEPIRGDDSG